MGKEVSVIDGIRMDFGAGTKNLFRMAILSEYPVVEPKTEASCERLRRDSAQDAGQRGDMYQPTPEDEMLDLEARCLLIGDSDLEKQAGIRLLCDRYRRPLMGFLSDGFPDLTEDERASAINDSFIKIYRKAVDGSLNTDEELSGLIFTIAKRRAIDSRRKNTRRIPSGARLLEEVGDHLKDTEAGSDWRLAGILGKADDVTKEFREFVKTLKATRQRHVASVMADALPGWLTDMEIADEIRERFGIHVSQLEVKGAKQAFMKKLRDSLKRTMK